MKALQTLAAFVLLSGLASAVQAEPPRLPVGLSAPTPPPPKEHTQRQIIIQALVVRMSLSDDMLEGNPAGLNIGVIKGDPSEQIRAFKPNVLSRPQIRTLDGQSAMIAIGSSMHVQTPAELQTDNEQLDVGTKFEIMPRILKEEKIWMRFKWEQSSAREISREDQEKKSAAASRNEALMTGFINEGVATASPGETIVISHPDLEAPEKDGANQQYFIFLTPRIVEEEPKPAPRPQPAPDKSVSVVEIETQDTNSQLQWDRRADLYLEVNQTGFLTSPENIRSVSVTGSRAKSVKVTAEGNRKLRVEATHTGTAMLQVTDVNGNNYQAMVWVNPAKGTAAVQETLSQLFPSANLKVIAINDSLLLRGSVTKDEHIQQITEIAEQFAPKVLNHLVVPAEATPAIPPANQANPLAMMMGGSGRTESPKTPENNDVQQLRRDVKSLHEDVKRLIELLERKEAKPQANLNPYSAPQLPSYAPPQAAGPYSPKPAPQSDSQPYSIPQPLPSPYAPTPPNAPTIVPRYDVEPPRPVEPIPNHTGPSPTQPLPNHTGPNPVIPVPKQTSDSIVPVLPTPAPEKAEEPKPLQTQALPEDLDPTAFVRVRVVKISSPNDSDGQPIDETLGSGVVIDSEPGKAVVLTAAHLLRNYQPGKYVLQVATADGFRPATIIMQDDNANVALLRAKFPHTVGTVSLARHSLPERGESVRSVGYRKGVDQKPVMVNAFVSHDNRYQWLENFEFGGLIPQGFSGAAVLDAKSQLIGIATAVDKENKQTVCSPAAEIRKLLAISE